MKSMWEVPAKKYFTGINEVGHMKIQWKLSVLLVIVVERAQAAFPCSALLSYGQQL